MSWFCIRRIGAQEFGRAARLQQRLITLDAGIVEGRIEAAKGAQRVRHHGIHVRRIGHIGAQEFGRAARLVDVARRCLAARFIDIGDKNLGPGRSHRLHRRPPNPGRATRYQSYTILQHYFAASQIQMMEKLAGRQRQDSKLLVSATLAN